MTTRVHLLGAAQVQHGGVLHHPALDKRLCLLAYLACVGGPVPRERLAFLFWPDVESARARANLRGLLARLKPLPFTRGVAAEPGRVAWPVACDVGEFREAIEAREWERALSRYRGELLAGLQPDDSPEFAAWLELERDHLHEAWRSAVAARTEELLGERRPAEAARLLETALRSEEEPAEELVQAYLRIAALCGQGEAALRRYRAFAERLEREYGAAPLPATQALAVALENRAPGEALVAPPPVDGHARAAVARGLPAFPTPFVGRDPEMAEVLTILAAPDCRLLTLVGPGGIGKTRLAAQAALGAAAEFRDGAAFVPLAAVEGFERTVGAIAGALDLPMSGQAPTEQQLLGWLRRKQLLLVLDNFEHLLSTARLLSGLLEECPDVKLLVTSRVRLKLAREWLFEVGGLDSPPGPEDAHFEQRDAVQLFMRTLGRFQSGIGIGPGGRPAIAKVCALVGGSPLGIELAASLTRLLPLGQVAREVERDLDALSDPMQDLAEERRSLRAVFDRSWGLLTSDQQRVLAGLTVFRGGFTREAAEQVAGASLRALLALLDASLLKRRPDGRFDLHELIRQYAAERLEPGEEAQLRDRHAACYSTLLARLEDPIQGGPGQVAALEVVEDEIDNLWAAWDHAAEQGDAAALDACVECLWRYCEIRGHFRQGEEAFSRAAASVPEGSAAQARLLARLGALAHRLMHLELSQEASARSIAVSERLGRPPEATALINLAVVPLLRGNIARSAELHLEMLALGEELADPLIMSSALSNLAEIRLQQRDLDDAHRLLNRSLLLKRQRDDKWALTFGLHNLARIHLERGSPQLALELLVEALEAARAIGFKLMSGHILASLAQAQLVLGQREQAGSSCDQGRALWLELGNLGPFEVESLRDVARVYGELGRDAEALATYREVISRSLDHGLGELALEAVVAVAAIQARRGAVAPALELAYSAIERLPPESKVRERARAVHEALAPAVPPDALSHARKRGEALDLASLVGPDGERYFASPSGSLLPSPGS